MIQTLTIDGWQPTPLNVLMRQQRHVRNRSLKSDAQVIGAEARCQRITTASGRRAVFLVIRYCRRTGAGDVAPDALWKSLLDGMCAAGLLRGVCRQWLELGPVLHEAADRPGIKVIIRDID